MEQHESHDTRMRTTAFCIMGLAALLSARWCLNLAEEFASAAYSTQGDTAFYLALILVCVLCATNTNRVAHLKDSYLFRAAILVGLLVGSFLFIFAAVLPYGLVLKVVGGGILGLAFCFVMLSWFARICTVDPQLIAITLSSAYLATGIVYFVLAALPAIAVCAIVTLLPLVSGILLFASTPKSDKASANDPLSLIALDRRPHPRGTWSFPVYPVVLMVVFKLAFNFSLAFSHGASMYGPLGIFIVSALTLVLSAIFYDRLSPSILFKLALPCMVIGLLMIAWVQLGTNVATLFSNMGNIAFELFILITLAEASRRYSVNPYWLFGIVEGFAFAATCIGRVAGRLYISTFPAGTTLSNTIMMLVVVGLVTLSIFFPAERLALRTFGESASAAPAQPADEETDASDTIQDGGLNGLELLCATISRRFELSRREEQILGLLLQEMSVAQIQEELTISHSTVKSHIQHIYEKTGVHSREELKALARSHDAGDM